MPGMGGGWSHNQLWLWHGCQPVRSWWPHEISQIRKEAARQGNDGVWGRLLEGGREGQHRCLTTSRVQSVMMALKQLILALGSRLTAEAVDDARDGVRVAAVAVMALVAALLVERLVVCASSTPSMTSKHGCPSPSWSVNTSTRLC